VNVLRRYMLIRNFGKGSVYGAFLLLKKK